MRGRCKGDVCDLSAASGKNSRSASSKMPEHDVTIITLFRQKVRQSQRQTQSIHICLSLFCSTGIDRIVLRLVKLYSSYWMCMSQAHKLQANFSSAEWCYSLKWKILALKRWPINLFGAKDHGKQCQQKKNTNAFESNFIH